MTTAKGAGRRRLPGLTVDEGYTRHPFDEKYGVRTSGLVAGRHLQSGHRHDRHATAYFAVAPSVFQALVRRWQRSRPAWAIEDYSFIDVGAGMDEPCCWPRNCLFAGWWEWNSIPRWRGLHGKIWLFGGHRGARRRHENHL